MLTRCSVVTKAGQPCNAQARQGGYCLAHAPQLAEDRRRWTAKGGQNRSNRARARRELADDALTLRESGAILGRLLRRLESGETEPGVVSAAANAVRALAALEAVTKLEDRITELETRAAETIDRRRA